MANCRLIGHIQYAPSPIVYNHLPQQQPQHQQAFSDAAQVSFNTIAGPYFSHPGYIPSQGEQHLQQLEQIQQGPQLQPVQSIQIQPVQQIQQVSQPQQVQQSPQLQQVQQIQQVQQFQQQVPVQVNYQPTGYAQYSPIIQSNYIQRPGPTARYLQPSYVAPYLRNVQFQPQFIGIQQQQQQQPQAYAPYNSFVSPPALQSFGLQVQQQQQQQFVTNQQQVQNQPQHAQGFQQQQQQQQQSFPVQNYQSVQPLQQQVTATPRPVPAPVQKVTTVQHFPARPVNSLPVNPPKNAHHYPATFSTKSTAPVVYQQTLGSAPTFQPQQQQTFNGGSPSSKSSANSVFRTSFSVAAKPSQQIVAPAPTQVLRAPFTGPVIQQQQQQRAPVQTPAPVPAPSNGGAQVIQSSPYFTQTVYPTGAIPSRPLTSSSASASSPLARNPINIPSTSLVAPLHQNSLQYQQPKPQLLPQQPQQQQKIFSSHQTKYSPSTSVSHAKFQGMGVHYEW